MLYILRLTAFLTCALLLTSCSWIGLDSSYKNDPFTGGENVSYSSLLEIRLPAGLQLYSSHGFINKGSGEGAEGLEIYRGNISPALAAADLFNELHKNGWELRLSLRKGHRSAALYQKSGRLAILTTRSQGMLTILDIWAGSRLPDGAALSFEQGGREEPEDDGESYVELPGEEYGPLDGQKAPENKAEKWGSAIEEREL